QRTAAHRLRALITLAKSAALLLGRDVVVDRSACDPRDCLVRDHVDRFHRIVGPVRERDGDDVRLLALRHRAAFAVARQGTQDLALCLPGVVENSLYASTVA